jgi:(5-formylfuran-3-yl)methyl phosphate synthase
MTGLLVSVRNAMEAVVALDGGADLIDVKEPARGALGAADGAVWLDVLAVVARRVPTSAALGELADSPALPSHPALQGFNFAKLGLAGCGDQPHWSERWTWAVTQLPAETVPVAVVYADWQAARTPPPDEIVAVAARCGCGAVLVDTYVKAGATLLDLGAALPLAPLIESARDLGLKIVLGGGLGHESIPRVLALRPDYVAVRGAACRGARTDAVDGTLVRGLKQLLVA